MRRIPIALFALAALTGTANAQAPATVRLCAGTQPNCPLIATANPLPIAIVSGGSGGGPVTIADGADVAKGSTTDAAATAGSTGTVSAKLRFLTSVAFATSTNQTSQITQETAINTILGLQADAACSTDNGTCTIAALIKRTNQRLTTAIAGTAVTQSTSPWIVAGGGTAGTAATGVVTVQGIASMTPIQTTQSTAGNVPIGITPTDRTVTSATGSSQTVMSSNASRKQLTIVNTGNANCGVNPTGGTAAIGGAGTLTLMPGGSYTPRVPTLAAVTAICTAAQPLYADES